ncbi:MAG TPA: hypothetical protein VIQ52_16175 [Arthrobacter sp.]
MTPSGISPATSPEREASLLASIPTGVLAALGAADRVHTTTQYIGIADP